MDSCDVTPITELLRLAQSGDTKAEERAYRALFAELRRLAAARMRNERSDHTLQPTALVNEAYMRLAAQDEKIYASRAHFLAIAAQVMHHVLVDYARRRRSQKRFGDLQRVDLDESLSDSSGGWSHQVLSLDRHLARLAEFDPRAAKVMELKVFAGMTETEIATVVNRHPRTIKRDLKAARTWLAIEMKGDVPTKAKTAAVAAQAGERNE